LRRMVHHRGTDKPLVDEAEAPVNAGRAHEARGRDRGLGDECGDPASCSPRRSGKPGRSTLITSSSPSAKALAMRPARSGRRARPP
jgi:hypothetical protein